MENNGDLNMVGPVAGPSAIDLTRDDTGPSQDDIIIVDDPAMALPPLPAPMPAPPVRRPTRQRTAGRPRAAPLSPTSGMARLTRQGSQPKKLKLKLNSSSGTTSAYPAGTSFLGPYDRELDSSDDDLTFEEQFILRVPEEHGMAEEMRKRVAKKEIGSDVWFKFKDPRRALFNIGDTTYNAKLVDLPCIIESHKTIDNKQMYKVADICQMLFVEPTAVGDNPSSERTFNVDEFIYPHGITPPLKHVRKRRFRKRINKTTIETVELEVERLLEADAQALTTTYDVIENVDPDLSDAEFEPQMPMSPGMEGDELDTEGGSLTSTPYPGDEDEEGEDDEFDNELAAELDKALADDREDATTTRTSRSGRSSRTGTGSDEETDTEEFSEYSESDDDEAEDDEDDGRAREENELRQRRRLLAEEISDLEKAVEKKQAEVDRTGNAVIKKRLDDTLKKLSTDLELKRVQLETMRIEKAERRREKEEREEERRMEEEEARFDAEAHERTAEAVKAIEAATAKLGTGPAGSAVAEVPAKVEGLGGSSGAAAGTAAR